MYSIYSPMAVRGKDILCARKVCLEALEEKRARPSKRVKCLSGRVPFSGLCRSFAQSLVPHRLALHRKIALGFTQWAVGQTYPVSQF